MAFYFEFTFRELWHSFLTDTDRALCSTDPMELKVFWNRELDLAEKELSLNNEDIEGPELMLIIIIKLLTSIFGLASNTYTT